MILLLWTFIYWTLQIKTAILKAQIFPPGFYFRHSISFRLLNWCTCCWILNLLEFLYNAIYLTNVTLENFLMKFFFYKKRGLFCLIDETHRK